jgi:hypothetical protein
MSPFPKNVHLLISGVMPGGIKVRAFEIRR